MTDTIPPLEDGDFQCIVHMTDFDPDCPSCQNEVTFVESQVRQAANANTLSEARLRQFGVTASVTNILAIRLNTLIESATGGNPKVKARFEMSFMANYAAALAQAEQNAVRAKLMHGVRGG